MLKKKYVLFVLLFAFLGFCLSVTPYVCAQPMEEEEEPIQARPNPMEKTTKGASVMQKGMKSKTSMGRSNVMNKGKAVSSQVSQKGKAAGKAKGIASNGINSNGINSNGMVMDDGQHNDGKIKNIKGKQAAYDGVDGESKGKKVGAPKAAKGLNVFKGNKAKSAYGNVATGASSTATQTQQQMGTNPAGWDPTDMPSGSLEQEFGGGQIGY